MRERLSEQILCVVALICLAIGSAMTIRTMRMAGESVAKLERKSKDMATLQAVEREIKIGAEAVRMFEEIADRKPAQIIGLLREALPGCAPEDVKETRVETVAGWIARQKSVTLNDVELGKLMTFLAGVESLRPPWRLASVVIRPSSRSPGVARVELSLESVEKAP